MKFRTRRIIITALIAEFLAVAALIAVPVALTIFGGVALFGSAEADLQRYGRWVAPIAGFPFCLLGGWWVARRWDRDRQWNGLALGLLVAGLDLALLAVAGAPLAWIFIVSTALRVGGGWLGGGLAGAQSR
jgi:hypothetical protein